MHSHTASADAVRPSSTTWTVLTGTAIAITVVAAILTAIYMTGYADDVVEYLAKKYYKAKAKAEATALAHAEGEKAQSYLKDQLKKNPIMGESELDQVSGGLGKEAKKEGLAGVSGKLGGLGKF